MRVKTLLMMVAAGLLVAAPIVQANGLQAQLHMGRHFTAPENDGAEAPNIMDPVPQEGAQGDGYSQQIKRSWVQHTNKQGTYMFSTSWTDPNNDTWEDAVSFCFRSHNYNYPPVYTTDDPDGHWNYVYPIQTEEILRWKRPDLILELATPDTMLNFVFFPVEGGLAGTFEEFTYPASGGRGPVSNLGSMPRS